MCFGEAASHVLIRLLVYYFQLSASKEARKVSGACSTELA